MSQNPLHKFYRNEKFFTDLPSGIGYYADGVINLNDAGEVGILPMTAKDEVSIKNPDALLNGEALAHIISSCVPAVKQPKKLLTNDIDTLLIAIRHATYGNEIEITSACTECNTENTFDLSITQTMANMKKVEADYTVEIENGIVFHVRPFTYVETMCALQTQFEQLRVTRELSVETLSEDARLKIFSKQFNKFVDRNSEIIAKCITSITKEDDGINVTEYAHILDFLNNVSQTTFKEIDKLIQDVNKIGVNKEFSATCSKCSHQWEAGINFNPVSFFTES